MAFVEENKSVIVQALAKAGIKKATVCYSGSGDSGCIEDISFDDEDLTNNLSVAIFRNKSQFDKNKNIWKESVCKDPMPIKEAMEYLCYDLLEKNHPGWENNDGADGEFIFIVDSGEIEWQHNERYTEYNTYNVKV